MNKPLIYALAAAIGIAAARPAAAQQQVDIGLHRNGDRLEVHLRPSESFDGILSSLVFTVRWDRSSGASLGRLEQAAPAASYLPIMKSGGLREQGSFNYQVFAGFGVTPLAAFEARMNAGEEVVIASIPVSGKGDFELVNDAWTREQANNGEFYVAMGGRDRTGIIYKGLAAAEEDGSISVLPNPNNGRFMVSFGCSQPTDVVVEVLNALGQSVYTETLRAFEGQYRKEMDLTTMSNGAYYLKVKRNGEASTHKVVYR